MIVFRKPLPGVERPAMEADVVIVGGGPAGMACALRLSQLIDEHNAGHPEARLTKENIYLLEKAREVGAHCLSGALLDPRSMRELLPGFEKEAPLPLSVLQIIDPKTNLPSRIRRIRQSDGSSVRVAVRSGEQLPLPAKVR